ncbi:MAG: hypothetical protein MUD17_07260 [Gemmatimonadaceae bacterium]|jgi:hypothetical protein|nr:hypothetical protein [Gemmatimonadaceae bacterium]
MSPDRRFDDREIAAIFERAGLLQEAERHPKAGEGLTLAQLQEIARDVGLDPTHVAAAARDVAAGTLAPATRRAWFGLPIGVARTIEFHRPVSDAQWSALVVTLRETFDARGRVVSDGPFREWSNGNLQALLEPTATGHRLRLSTRKGNAKARVIIGASYLWLALVFALLGTLGAVSPRAAVAAPLLLGVLGVATLGATVFGLPRWAALRGRQMDAIAARAAELVP